MQTSSKSPLLGEILQNAGLISSSQTKMVLLERQYNFEPRFGEALAAKGWIEQRTANFFAEEWDTILQQPERQPLGFYLEKSGLLTKQQIASILQEQKQIWVKFGSVAILQGLLKQQTVNFFLNHLSPLSLCCSSLIGRKNNEVNQAKSTPITVNLSLTPIDYTPIDYEDIPWID